jgi:hypothetical protein
MIDYVNILYTIPKKYARGINKRYFYYARKIEKRNGLTTFIFWRRNLGIVSPISKTDIRISRGL